MKRILITTTIILFLCNYFICFAQSGHWEKLNPKESPPRLSSFGMAQLDENKVIIFGGDDLINNKLSDETWIFDLNENIWYKINTLLRPPKRFGLGMAQLSKGKVIIFGGWDPINIINLGFLSDTWVFDITDSSWTEMKPENHPAGRESHSISQITENKIILFGGMTDVGFVSDTWIYDYNENNWTRIYTQFGKYPIDREASMMAMIDTGKALLYGGWQFKNIIKKKLKFKKKSKKTKVRHFPQK